MRRVALIALLLTSCYEYPEGGSCEATTPLPDAVDTPCDEDLDGDGVLNCEDDDADGDGLRNDWDCEPADGESIEVPAGGLCGDGDLVVPAGESAEIDVAYTRLMDSAVAGSTTLSVAKGVAFAEGDEILIINQQGPDAGVYEWVYVAAADEETITVEPYIQNDYTVDGDSVVRIQVVPHYNDVTVEGTLTTSSWDEDVGGGVLFFRACGAVSVGSSGYIDMQGNGFEGGDGVAGNEDSPFTGESWNGPPVRSEPSDEVSEDYPIGANNEGGGGAPVTDDVDGLEDQAAGGGGGAHATDGDDGQGNDGELLALGGEAYGQSDLSVWNLGSGGGAGGADTEAIDGADEDNVSGDGGDGGGIITIFAREDLSVLGYVDADGGRGADAQSDRGEVGGGGGGGGGILWFVAPTVDLSGEVSAKGGGGGCPASDGEVESGCTDADTDEKGGRGGTGYARVDTTEFETSGTLDPEPADWHEGDFDEWCWEPENPFVPPCETDDDGDGHIAWECGGDDCDDSDPTIYTGATEVAADGIDQDCDGSDVCDETTWVQGGLKAGCATGGGAGAGALGLLGVALALGARRR